MREIEFRGLRSDGLNKGQWIIGSYATWIDSHSNKHYCIVSGNGRCNDIEPESVGQFTGKPDKKGNKIWEGDIIKFKYHWYNNTIKQEGEIIEGIGVVIFEDGAFQLKCITGHLHLSPQRVLLALDYRNIYYEIIGNTYENPELLKG